MANESVRITNGTVAMLSKVLREVQEVQSREVEVSQQPQQQQQQDTLQFNVGYVSLLKSRFAKSDQPPVDESKKKQLSARRDFAHGHVVTVTKNNAAVSDIVSQQDTPTFSSTPNIIVREVAQEREHDSAFQIIEPSIVQSSQTPNASPASNQSADEAHHIPDESVALQELPNTQAVPDSVVPAKSKVSQDSLKSKEEQTASIHNLKLMFEKLAVKKGNSQRTTYAAGSGSTSEVQSFNLKQSNASANANASASDAPQSSGPYSAYALFSVLRPQTNKSQDDDDDFASSSNEERESKLRSAADRIQVAGANVHLAKSAFLSDARRKASVDFTCTMADREKDTLTVSEEASALAADRNRRISFNDAAIAVTHEYPREESWNEDSENEPDAQAADNVDADADCSGDAVEVEQNQNEGEEEEDDDDGVTKSRLYALFALNSQDSHSTRSQLPTYDSVQQDHVDKLTNTRTDDEINLQSDGDSLSSSAHHPTLPAASEQNDVMTRTIDIANITRSNGAEVAEILYSDPL